MTLDDLEHFRNLLIEREKAVRDWLDSSPPVTDAEIRRAQLLLDQIRTALERVNGHSYGICEVCHGDLELYRLEVQPVREVCLGCISEQERDELENELFLASKIHRALLPQTMARVEGLEVAVKSHAARLVGGDYYDFLPAVRGIGTRVVIADVMGKGVPAGMLMSNVQGATRILAEEIESPALLMARLNRWLCRNVPVTKFVSMACIAIDPLTGGAARLTQTNAGHCPPLIIRKTGEIERLDPTGGVLGVHEGFEYTECVHEIHRGDLVILYTDGISEAANPAGDQFGEERLIEFVLRRKFDSLESLLNSLVDRVREFSGCVDLADDCTAVSFRMVS